jgi:hypothetical protein
VVAALRDELAQIEQDIEDGRASAGSLVQLFNAAAEAEQQRDSAALTRACMVARRLAQALGDGLAADAIRLLDHCGELLTRVQTAESTASPGRAAKTCPACGQELVGSPVRCRACGHLLV